MPVNFTVNKDDLAYILKQIVVAERFVAGETLQSIIGQDFAILPAGLRAVDGSNNNLLPGGSKFGAADTTFPRLLPPAYVTNTGTSPFFGVTNTNYAAPGSVVDSNPRTISNLIVDMTNANPAAISAWHNNPLAIAAYEAAHGGASPADSYIPTNEELSIIPNRSPDIGLSPGFNGWMTFFGQFFDHGLDLVTKGGNGTVFIPLNADDPLIAGNDHILGNADDLPTSLRFMALSRATPVNDPVTGLPTATNTTTGWVDQNQTYTSHPSHQVFLREYKFSVDTDNNGTMDSRAMSTGSLLDGKNSDGTSNHSIANWGEVKAQAKLMLGLTLTDKDVFNVPLLATDAYGEFIRGPNGFAQLVMPADSTHAAPWLLEGVAGGLAIPVAALRTGHAFLDDIAATAAPKAGLVADANTTVDDHLTGVSPGFYDNELLDAHFLTGDGRGNENIGLTTVHTIFHSEHNRLVAANKATIVASGDLAFINSWLLTPLATAADIPATAAGIAALNWDGERMFQAAKFVTEMQYQHLVFEEFARTVQPNVDPFVFTNSPDLNPDIVAEFAHVVYRFGHSMLTDTVSRLDVNLNANDVGLIEAFLNPLQFTASGATVEERTGAIIRGMTRQLGNEIDEFVVDAVRNNLLGLPLDLPALNMARAREQGIPSFNNARAQFYATTSDASLKPYDSWADYVLHIKNPLSIVNFIAAYGTHISVTSVTTLVEKRDAAMLLVLGNFDLNNDGIISANETAPLDRIDFLNHTGTWATTETGLNNIDFWIGGLAESKMEFGGMLGTTFNYVFEHQMENLQNGDRFYYLSRLQGLNLVNELEPNTFTALVMRNTDLGDLHSTHLPGKLFDTVDYTLELDPLVKQVTGLGLDGTADPTNPNAVLQALKPMVVRVGPGADIDGDGQGDGGFLRFTGGEHVVLGGSEGNDTLMGDRGIDTLWGDGGNDRLDAGSESDQVFGGDGDDIITDPFGDDLLRGDDGNDVISGGPGLDILFGGGGNDFITGNTDPKQVFAGRGDDFVLGGSAADDLMGNEGDDWIEGGEGFDGISGENSQLFFNSTIVGHDVLNGQGNDTDYDAENGDDIMVEGPGIQRNNGMDGFDWAIEKGNPNAADDDLGIRIFDTRPALILRDRFDSVEGLSGWKNNDILTGAAKLILGENFNNGLTQAGVDRIAGLRELLGIAPGAPDDVVLSPTIGEEIILGGAGSDVITGNLGDDIIDGDAWLNVRIAIHANKDGTGAVLFSVDSLNEVKARLLSGEINPGQMKIVREIVTTGVSATDVDTAVFSDVQANYTLSGNANGNLVVDHTGFVVGGVPAFDSRDTVSNIEVLRFTDANVAVFNGTNGADTIVGTAGADIMIGGRGDDTYTVNNAGDLVIEGVNRGTDTVLSSLTSYQAEANVENVTVTNIDAVRNQALVISVGGNGLDNVLTGHDRQAGVGGRDTLNGNGGNDMLLGLSGVDRLIGGAGNDLIDGGTQADTAVFGGPVQGYTFDLTAAGVTVTDRSGADGTDTLVAIENVEFNAQDFALVLGTNGINTTLSGGGGADLILGFAGNDILNGNAGSDVLVGGAGNDAVNGGAGADMVLWGVGDGRDVVNGGAGTDTARIMGDATQEAFHIYTRVAALAAGITGLDAATQIAITRTAGGPAAVIAELRNIEEIVITGNGGGDTFATHGDFTGTSLLMSTITIEGSGGDDTVDISALTSAHRIVFTSNGGHDTIIGMLRPQDVIELAPGLTIADYVRTSDANGMTTLTSVNHSVTFATGGNPQFGNTNNAPGGIDPAVTSPSFGYAFSDAEVEYHDDTIWLKGPDGSATEITDATTLTFTDGMINNNDGMPLVDDLFYFAKNIDVWKAHVDADAHYAQYGWQEGRDPNAFFSTKGYLGANPDVAAAGLNPLTHYSDYGQDEGRSVVLPSTVGQPVPVAATTFAFKFTDGQVDVSNGNHLLTAPDGTVTNLTGLATLSFIDGTIENNDGAPLVDDVFYFAKNIDVWNAHVDPDAHYAQYGWHEGRDPNAFFSTTDYLAANPDVAASGMNPLQHYDQYGWHEGRNPGAGFSTTGYLGANPDVAAAQVNPLQHYLQYGAAEGRPL